MPEKQGSEIRGQGWLTVAKIGLAEVGHTEIMRCRIAILGKTGWGGGVRFDCQAEVWGSDSRCLRAVFLLGGWAVGERETAALAGGCWKSSSGRGVGPSGAMAFSA